MSKSSTQQKKQQFIAQRRVARKLALIAIYQWQLTANEFSEIYLGFQEDKDLSSDLQKSDVAFFHDLSQRVIRDFKELDMALSPFLELDQKQLDPIEQAILRLACLELSHYPETPPLVVINEYTNLAKKFGAEQSHKFINAVLDKLMKSQQKNTKPGE